MYCLRRWQDRRLSAGRTGKMQSDPPHGLYCNGNSEKLPRKGHRHGLFSRLDKWAEENQIYRLELSVECPNEAARHLYERSGFSIEGIRKSSMYVNGEYVDEYYMAKILG